MTNKAANVLLQIEEDEITSHLLVLLNRPMSSILSQLKQENQTLVDVLELKNKVNLGTFSSAYSIKDGVLCYKDRFYIGEQSGLKMSLLEEFHSSLMAGHGGVKRKLIRLS